MSTRDRRTQPPRWLDRLVERFCAPHLREQIMGDLHERYYYILKREGEARARRMYLREVLAYIRPSVFRRKKHYRTSMFTNYFKVAFRNLLRKKIYSGINILGLSIGLASSFLILLWVIDENNYDKFHANGDQLFQVWRNMTTGGQTYTMNSQPRGIADEMLVEYPEVEDAVITFLDQEMVVTSGENNYRERGGYAGETFFNIFTFPFIHGDPATALKGLTSAVITEKTARKMYGDDWGHAVGRSMTVDHNKEFTITGIVKDVPENSSIQFDILLPVEEWFGREERFGEWYFMAYGVYAKLKQGTSLEAFNKKFADIFNRHADDNNHEIFLQPYEDIYLHSLYRDGKLVGGRIEYVRIFTAIAIFILVIASINFMNLATARSAQRAREIGVRKVIGAQRQSLVAQFITESIGMASLAFMLAIVLVVILLPAFNYLTGKHLTFASLTGTFLMSVIAIALVVGLISGSYPALYLSSFKPAAVLRGSLKQGTGMVGTLRKGLVVFQFALSVLLIVSTIVVYLQLNYMRTKDLGLDRENLVYVTREGALTDRYEAAALELSMQPGIESVTASNMNPLEVNVNTTSVNWDGKARDNRQLFYIVNAYYDYVKTMKMELVAGHDFSKIYADSMAYLVNEETARMIGGDVVGKWIKVYGASGPIVGVIKNFSMNSLYSPIGPVVIRQYLPWASNLYVRTKPGETQEAIESLMRIYQKFNPDYPFNYTFLDEQFEKRYRSEQVTAKLVNIFAVMAMFISCLGLFGLTSFTVEQRKKELGMRRVLGASVSGIVVMLNKDFLKLVVIGFVIATPVTYYMMTQWLQNFAERINIGAGVFLLTGLASMLVAILTVSWQSLKAAIANPVESLKNE
ncbi:MAG TPA: ABC transporter permease [Cyclobacteriaceae bacterium]|nr:ABC transporter permease [Cyclobacteriaceae bacterium]